MTPRDKLSPFTSQISDANWMITFGDLLTLLLCFFCATLSINPSKINALSTKPSDKEPGTSIASFGGREWVSVGGLAGAVEMREALVGAIPKLGGAHPTQSSAEIADIYVEVCDSSVDKPESWRWHQSMEVALRVKRQLIDDLRVGSEQISLRALGGRCDELAPPVKAQKREIGLGIRFQGRF